MEMGKLAKELLKKYNTRIWQAEYDLDLVIWDLREIIPEFDKYILKGDYPTSG